MQQAGDYMAALASATSFQIQGDGLELRDAGGNAVATFTAQPTSLPGTSWTVIGYNNGRGGVVSVIIGTEITAVFGEDGTMSGSAGCNNYTAAYEADDDGNISIGPAATTRMMCSDPEGIMEQEAEYLAALETAAVYRIEGERLQLRNAEGSLATDFTVAK
jgi:heat shock protein HslJ